MPKVKTITCGECKHFNRYDVPHCKFNSVEKWNIVDDCKHVKLDPAKKLKLVYDDTNQHRKGHDAKYIAIMKRRSARGGSAHK